MNSVDPDLVHAWLAARSLARGLPAPVADSGGWRVDTGSPSELRRYVFATPTNGLRRLANAIYAPHIALKLCGTEAAMRVQVPARWQLTSDSFMMTGDDATATARPLPPGYAGELTVTGPVASIRITTTTGELAASGYAADLDGVFAYDRIITDPAHGRRGLGSVVMATLASTRRSRASRQVLVATAAGRALYETLGWTICSPYTTALLPSDQQPK